MSFKAVFTMTNVTEGTNWIAEIQFSINSVDMSFNISSGTSNVETYNDTTIPIVNIVYPNSVPAAFSIDRRTTISSYPEAGGNGDIINNIVIRRCITHEGSGVSYITWRDAAAASNVGTNLNTPLIYGQYPITGYSFDIYQVDQPVGNKLTSDAINGTWNQYNTSNGKNYTLHPSKYSLIYNYDGLYPLIFSKGGTLNIKVFDIPD